MSTLDRYKKKGGFLQLLNLIESVEIEKIEKFMKLIESESRVWAEAIEQKRLTIEKISKLSEKILTPALDHLPPRVIAIALWKAPEELRTSILKALNGFQQKKVWNVWEHEEEPRPGDMHSCQIRLIQAIRQVLADNRTLAILLPDELKIPDDIESQLVQAHLNQILQEVSGTGINSDKGSMPSSKNSETGVSSTPSSGSEDQLKLKTALSQISALQEENLKLKKLLADAQAKLNEIKKIVS